MTTAATTVRALPVLARCTAAPAVHETTWKLEAGKAMQLRAWSTTVLKIRHGRAWVTLDTAAGQISEDLILGPGESITLARGERLVMEPWDYRGVTYTWEKV